MKNKKNLIGVLRQKISALKNIIASQRDAPSQLETGGTHSMGVAHENLVQNAAGVKNHMNDHDLRVDLEKQYGSANWARKPINEILAKRSAIDKIGEIGLTSLGRGGGYVSSWNLRSIAAEGIAFFEVGGSVIAVRVAQFEDTFLSLRTRACRG